MQYVFVALEGAMSTLGHERQSMRTRWYRIEKANLVWVVRHRCTYLFLPGTYRTYVRGFSKCKGFVPAEN